MKTYSVESAYAIPPHTVIEAIGAPSRMVQCTLILIAPSKKAAIELGLRCGLNLNRSGTGVHLSTSPLAESILVHRGKEEGVYATRLDYHDDDPVVRVHDRENIERVGYTAREGHGRIYRPDGA